MDRRAMLRTMGLGAMLGISALIAGGVLTGTGYSGVPSHLVPVAISGAAAAHYRGLSHLAAEPLAHAVAVRSGAAIAASGGPTSVPYVPMKHCDMQAHWAILSGSTVAS